MQFGGLVAVRDFRLALRDGELVGLIGPNGAGKTTVFNLVTGIYTPTAGEILLDSRRLDGQPPHLIARWGVARTFQNIRLFKELSVLDNVKAAFVHQAGYSFWEAVLALPRQQEKEREIERKCLALLKFFGLHERRHEKAKNLPYGDQRRLEIVRALALAPKVLLLDEPTAGMNPAETQAVMHLIKRLNDEWGLTILLIEHDMRVVMGICQRVIVMDFGEIIAEGSPEQIRTDPKVIAAYLGEPMEVETPADE
jgi:branched-chain amino acid transport system ATP-binding protein